MSTDKIDSLPWVVNSYSYSNIKKAQKFNIQGKSTQKFYSRGKSGQKIYSWQISGTGWKQMLRWIGIGASEETWMHNISKGNPQWEQIETWNTWNKCQRVQNLKAKQQNWNQRDSSPCVP